MSGTVDVDALLKPLLLKDLRIQCRQRKLSPAGSRADLAERLKDHMLATQDFALRNEDGSIMSGSQASQMFGQTSAGTGNNYQRPEGQNVGNFLGERPSSRVLAAPGGKSNFTFGDDISAAGSKAPEPEPEPAPAPTPPPAPAPEPPAKTNFLDQLTAKIVSSTGATPRTARSGRSFTSQTSAAEPAQPPAAAPAAPKPPPPAQAPDPAPPGSQAANIGVSNNNYNRPSGQNVGNFITDKPSSRVLAPPGGGSSFSFS